MKKEKFPGTWTANAVAGSFKAGAAATMPHFMEYAIEGLLPKTGASIWFGPGSTGKTQLLLWMAAHIAARQDSGPSHWLDAKIHKRGQILVLSAEDLREHIFLRLSGIAKALKAEYPNIDCEELCNRIHVIPFLSLDEDEFTAPNPSLFKGRRSRLHASPTLEGIEEFIQKWNDSVGDDDRIVGVIMDSAVSMAGFELANSEATTDFLFRVNRTSHRQGVFWAIVGHTPKGAAIKDGDPLDGAVDRLRGSAMWSTTPRTAVELRLAGDTEDLSEVHRAYPELRRRDIVIANVVMANSKTADFKPRVLRRLAEGAFEDLTTKVPGVCAAWDPTAPVATVAEHGDQLDAVVELIRNITDGGKTGETFTREQIEAEFREKSSSIPALASMIGDASKKKRTTRGTLAHAIGSLTKTQALKVQRTGKISVINLPSLALAA